MLDLHRTMIDPVRPSAWYATLLYTAYQCVTRSKRHLLCNSNIVLYGTVVEMYRRYIYKNINKRERGGERNIGSTVDIENYICM